MTNEPGVIVGVKKVKKSRSSVSAISETFQSLTRKLSREDEAGGEEVKESREDTEESRGSE